MASLALHRSTAETSEFHIGGVGESKEETRGECFRVGERWDWGKVGKAKEGTSSDEKVAAFCLQLQSPGNFGIFIEKYDKRSMI